MDLIRGSSLKTDGGGHAGFEDAAGIVDVDLDAEDEMFAIVGGLDIAGKEFALRCDLLDGAGEAPGEAFDADFGGLTEVDAGEACFGNPDSDPELGGLLQVEDDLIGRHEIAGADTDGLDDGVGGSNELGFAEAGVEFGDVALGLRETATSGVDVFAAETLAGEDGGCIGLAGTGFGGAQIFRACAGLEKSEALAGGLGAFASGVALVAGVVELLAGDDVAGGELLHAMEVGVGVEGVGLGSCVVGLGLVELFGARPVFGFVEGGGLDAGRGFGLLDFFRTIAAEHAIEAGAGLIDSGGSLRALGFQFIAFEADEEGAGGDVLAFFDGDGEYAAADLGADLDFAGFDGAGVGEGGAVLEVSDDGPDSGEECDDDGGEDDLSLHCGTLGPSGASLFSCEAEAEKVTRASFRGVYAG